MTLLVSTEFLFAGDASVSFPFDLYLSASKGCLLKGFFGFGHTEFLCLKQVFLLHGFCLSVCHYTEILPCLDLSCL